MVKSKLQAVFGSLSDGTRRDILRQLANGPLPVSQIAKAYDMSLPAVTKHLGVLEEAGVILKEKRGRQHIIRLSPDALQEVSRHLQQYGAALNNRLDALDSYLHGRLEDASTGQTAGRHDDRQELVLTHIFDADVETVWQRYTDPAHVVKWWAPEGTVLIRCENDVYNGGFWRFVLKDSHDIRYIFSGIYSQVDYLQRLVYTDGTGEPDQPRPEAEVTVLFERLPDGKTRLTKKSLAHPAVHQLNAAWLKSAAGK